MTAEERAEMLRQMSTDADANDAMKVERIRQVH
jgi:hypothetical protein